MLPPLVAFLAENLGLQNCSIVLYDCMVSYKDNEELITKFERVLFSNMQNTKTPLFMHDPAKDFLFQAFEGVDRIGREVMVMPLLKGMNLVGILVLYGGGDAGLKQQYDKLSQAAEVIAQAITHAKSLRQAQTSAITDTLTGLYNKGYFSEALKHEIVRAAKFSRPTSLILFDIDHFKEYNDTYGHPAGDQVLKDIAQVIQESIDTTDMACRYGGEEFAVILPEAKQDKVQHTAERLRHAVENFSFAHRKNTISIGALTCLNSSVSASNMINEADKALYKSKALGRNKVTNIIIVDKSLSPIDVDLASGQ